MNKVSLHLIQDWVSKASRESLSELFKSLNQETYDKLFWAIVSRDESKEFEFSIKDYLHEWKVEFDSRYSSLEETLVLERLELTKNSKDEELNKEYHYLSYWYDKEQQVNGLFNYW